MEKVKHDVAICAATKGDRARFWSKVTRTSKCWTYKTSDSLEYGRFRLNGALVNAHRVAALWSAKKPMINFLACHKCKTKNCVRPSHIYWGTPASNAFDKIADGTSKPLSHKGSLHPLAKLTEKKVIDIYRAIAKGGISAQDVARKHNVTASAVQHIVKRKRWLHVLAQEPAILLTRSQRGHVRNERHHAAVLNTDMVMRIRVLIAEGVNDKVIGSQYGVHRYTVRDIRVGKTWKNVNPA